MGSGFRVSRVYGDSPEKLPHALLHAPYAVYKRRTPGKPSLFGVLKLQSKEDNAFSEHVRASCISALADAHLTLYKT